MIFILAGERNEKIPKKMNKKNTDIKKENEALKQELLEYKSLEEDLMARRVFEKARKILITYLSIGGLILVISGAIGIKSIIDYAKSIAKEKIKSVSQEEVTAALNTEAQRQITSMVQEREEEFLLIAQQQVTRIVSASQPIALPKKKAGSISIDSEIDYTDKLEAVRDQGNEGSSVAFAVTAALEYYVNTVRNDRLYLSPRHLYYYARLKGGVPIEQDAGAFIRDAVSVLLERGAISEEAWKYKPGEFAEKPPNNLVSAIHYKIKHAATVSNAEELKVALFSHGPVVGGIAFFRSSFYEATVSKTGKIKMPASNESQIGGHAICFVGYDDSKRLFKFRNSWGMRWGDKGYGYLPYDYVDRFLKDAWVFTM